MFLIAFTFITTTAASAALAWLGLRRVLHYLEGNSEATRFVVEHVVVPLIGRKAVGDQVEKREGES